MFLLGNRGWIFANCQSRKSRAHHLALRPCLVLQGAAEGHGAKPSRRIPRPLLACSERNQYGNADTQSIARLAEAREERKVHKLADLAFPMDLCWKCHQTIWRTTRAALLQNYQLHKHETNYRTFPSGICKRTFPDAPWSSEVRIGSSTIELVNKKLSKHIESIKCKGLKLQTMMHRGSRRQTRLSNMYMQQSNNHPFLAAQMYSHIWREVHPSLTLNGTMTLFPFSLTYIRRLLCPFWRAHTLHGATMVTPQQVLLFGGRWPAKWTKWTNSQSHRDDETTPQTAHSL